MNRRTLLAILSVLMVAAVHVHAQPTLVRGVAGGGAMNAAGSSLTLRAAVGQTVTGPVSGGSLTNGQGFWYVVGSGSDSPVLLLDLALWLEGPYNGTDMSVTLSSVLPETDPYYGTEEVTNGFFISDATGQKVVDWVWLELRSGDPDSPPMAVQAQRAALLRSDGTIVDTDGTGHVAFSGLDPGPYWLVVGHRNHLAVMTPNEIDCTSGFCSHDFTQGSAYGQNPQVDVGGADTGPWAFYAGDGDASGGTGAADHALWLQHNGIAGYHAGDYNLSGGNTAADQTLWLKNNDLITKVPSPGK